MIQAADREHRLGIAPCYNARMSALNSWEEQEMSKFFAPIAVVLSSLLATSLSLADEEEPLNLRIASELYEPAFLEYSEVPLPDTIEHLEDDRNQRLDFDIDISAFKEANIDPNSVAITYKAPSTRSEKGDVTTDWPLYRSLSEMLAEHHLSFMAKGDTVFITTSKAAEAWQKKFKSYVDAQDAAKERRAAKLRNQKRP
jgi:hypothetical protein